MDKLKNRKEIQEGGILKGGSSIKNKTGSWRFKVPIIDNEKCINCMMCVVNCPEKAINIKKTKNEVLRDKINYDYCKGCGICAQVCPVKAITMYDKEVAKKLLKNKKYSTIKQKKESQKS